MRVARAVPVTRRTPEDKVQINLEPDFVEPVAQGIRVLKTRGAREAMGKAQVLVPWWTQFYDDPDAWARLISPAVDSRIGLAAEPFPLHVTAEVRVLPVGAEARVLPVGAESGLLAVAAEPKVEEV